MCGRYALHSLIEDLQQHFGLFTDIDFRPSYNIPPSIHVPVVRGHNADLEMALCQWGLVPHWVKGAPRSRPINARAETVAHKPFFRDAFRSRRCLVPANGYFEWRREGPRKQPFFIHHADRDLFAFAGLWESHGSGADRLETCAIITTDANDATRAVHDRMPVILDPEQYGRWLGDAGTDLLRPYAGSLACHPVSTRVNSPDNNDAELLAPA